MVPLSFIGYRVKTKYAGPTLITHTFVINTVVKRFNHTDYKTEHQPTLLSVIGF
jgi:hypothetical protein